LRCPRNATRGLQSVVQAFIIKNLIFDNRPKDKSVPIEQLLKPTEVQQQTALWSALAEILWNVGEKAKVVIAIPGEIPQIPHSQTYFQDTITEKLYLFEFVKLDDVQIFIKLHLGHVRVLGHKFGRIKEYDSIFSVFRKSWMWSAVITLRGRLDAYLREVNFY
jgi:Domain of unknown function (DUF4205)